MTATDDQTPDTITVRVACKAPYRYSADGSDTPPVGTVMTPTFVPYVSGPLVRVDHRDDGDYIVIDAELTPDLAAQVDQPGFPYTTAE